MNIEFSSADKNIVIYGESRCGISTLAKTLIKLNCYYTGSTYINGKELRNINSSQIKDEIIYLSNVVQIKEITTIDFLIGGRKILNEIINVCRDLNIFEFINCLSRKFSYLISEEGKNISLG